jgi:hypothetical protein
MVAGMLGLGLGGGRPPPAAPAAAATACLVRITAAAKIQHQQRAPGSGVGTATPGLGGDAACGGDGSTHAASPTWAWVAQGAVSALAGPVNSPQLLDRSQVVAAPPSGEASGGPLAGLAVGRQPTAAAPVELSRRPNSATPRTTLDRGHAAAPPERLARRALAEAKAKRVK